MISPDNLEELIKYRLIRADETYSDAKMLIDKGSILSGINRLYYACFYTVLAYLLKIGISTKTHDGAKAMLGKHLILTGLLSRDMGSFYSDLLNLRISGDYDEFLVIDPEQAREMLSTAREFIDRMNTLCTC